MNKRIYSLLCLTLQVVLVNAQESKSLNEVVITATQSEKKLGDIGKIVKIISREDIERAQGRTLAQLLSQVVGVNVSGSDSNIGENLSLFVRGSSAGNTLLLVDGISLNDASSITNDYNLAAITIDQIERIEILKGASSTLWGSDAVAGVVNIITKKGYGNMQGNMLASAGSYNTFKQNVGMSGKLNQTSLAFNWMRIQSDGFSSAKNVSGGDPFETDAFKQHSLNANAGRNITSKINVNLGVNYSRSIAGYDAGAFTDNRENDLFKKSFLASLKSRYQLDKGELSLIFSQNNISNRFEESGIITNNKGSVSNIQTILVYRLNELFDITSGINYKYTSTDQKSPYATLSRDDANSHLMSVYTSLFFKKGIFRNELGGRYNYHSSYGDNFTYTLNPSLLFLGKYKVYANLSSAYKVPGLYQLASDFKNENGLKPETTYNTEFGLETDILADKLFLSASFFKRRIKDVIDFGMSPTGKFQYENANTEKAEGLEADITFKWNKLFRLSAFYTYTDGYIVKDISESPIMRRPKHSAGASLDYTISKRVAAVLIHKWIGERHDTYFDLSSYATNEVKLSGYHRTDLYIQYQPSQKFVFFIDAKNVFDRQFSEFIGYNSAGINFNTGINFKIQ